LTAFFTPFMSSAINVALPAIQKDFQMDAVLLSWVQLAFLLSTAVFLVPFGRLADIYGRKRLFICGTWIFTAGTLMAAVSTFGWMLILFRVVQGLGSSMIFVTGLALLTSVYPISQRGKVIGVNVAAIYMGLSAGPFFGGVLTEIASWRSIFFVTVPLAIPIIYLATYRLQGEWAEARGERFDVIGSVLYGAAITLIMYGLSALPSAHSIVCIIAGTALLVGFVIRELRIDYPVFSIELFVSNRAFAFSSLAALIHYAATFAISFNLSLYLQYIKGLDPKSAGLALVAQPVMMALFSPLAGTLSDRIEHRKVASLGMAITATGLFLLSRLNFETTIFHVVAVLLLLGFGYALFSSPNMNAIMSSVDKRQFGVASGAVASMRLLGQMFSIGIATVLFALYIGRVEIRPELYPILIMCLNIAFTVYGVLCVVGIAASLARGKVGAE
jgi:EmrB/QacA subfamily drug resistance transporter